MRFQEVLNPSATDSSVLSLEENDAGEFLVPCEDCGKLKSNSPVTSSQSPIKCPICDDVNTGYHYGVESCESCKGFFRRAVQRKEVFTCKFDNQCTVSLYTRRNCGACRFNKCIQKGMLRSAVRENRRRGGCKRYALSPKKQLSGSTDREDESTGAASDRCKCPPPTSIVACRTPSRSGESCVSSPCPTSLACHSDPDNCNSNISPLLLIKQCFMSYDECIKQPNMILEQTLYHPSSHSVVPGLTSYPTRDESVIKSNPRSNQALYPPLTANALLVHNSVGLEPSSNGILHVTQFVSARKHTNYVERNIKWAASFFDQDVRCVLMRLTNNWITLGFFDYLIQLSSGQCNPHSPTHGLPPSFACSSPILRSLQQTHPYFSPIAYRSSLLGDRHQLKPGCDPITERENDVMIAKMQNDMNYYAETSGIDLGSLERMLSSEHTEEVGGVSLIGIAQQLNELKLTTGEVSIARLVLLLSTGLNTTLTESLLRFQVAILQAFESFCKSEDDITSDPYGRFNTICLVLFDIERYVSSNLATEMKANNILRPFLDECPSETEVMELFYSVVTHRKLTSPRPYLNEYAPPRKVLRASPPTSHFPLAI